MEWGAQYQRLSKLGGKVNSSRLEEGGASGTGKQCVCERASESRAAYNIGIDYKVVPSPLGTIADVEVAID
jgi:hypothetical protein